MLELAIVAAGGAALGITASIAIWAGWRRAADGERRAGESAVLASNLDGKLLAATASGERWKERASELQTKADNLQALLEQTVEDLPPGGARERMHARWFALHAGRTTLPAASVQPVPVPAEPAAPGPEDLLKPGE